MRHRHDDPAGPTEVGLHDPEARITSHAPHLRAQGLATVGRERCRQEIVIDVTDLRQRRARDAPLPTPDIDATDLPTAPAASREVTATGWLRTDGHGHVPPNENVAWST